MDEIADLQTELICRYDRDFRLTYVNMAYSEWLGLPKNQLIGHTLLEFISSTEYSRLITHLQSLTLNYPIAASTYRGIKSDSTHATIEWTDRALFDEQGNLTGYLGVGRDVTEREKQNQEILDLKNQLASVLDSMRDTIMSISLPERHLIYASASIEKIFGYPIQSFLNDLDFYKQIIHPGDLDQVITAQQICLQEGEVELDHRIIWPDGQVRWLHRHAWVSYDENGHPDKVIDIASDITDRKLAELALQETNQTLELFVQHAPASIVMLDRDMKYLAASRRWFIDNGLPYQNIIGRAHYEFLPDLPERWRESHRRGLAGAIESCEAESFTRADGTREWIRWEVRPWHNSQGQIGGILIFNELITAQKEAEDALRRSEARYRQMFEVHGLPKLIIDPASGQIVDANPAAAEYYGYALPTLKTLSVSDINPITSAQIKNNIGKALTSRLTAFQLRHRLADGTIRDVEVYSGPVDYDGRPLLYSTITDVTEREKAKSALEEANNLLERRVGERTAELEDLYNNAPNGYHSLDRNGFVVRINDTELNWLGYSREEVVGKLHITDLLPPASQAIFREAFSLLLQTGSVKDIEVEIRRKDGNLLPILVSATAIKDESGNLLFTRSNIFDNTDLIKARQTLAEERNLLRTIIDTIPDYIYVKDINHRMVLSNLAHARSLGFNDPAEVNGKNDSDFLPVEIVAKVHTGEEQLLQTGQPIRNSEEHILNQAGVETWALTTILPLRNLAGEITGLVGITRDITERKQAEETLRENEERYRLLAENINDLIIKLTPSGLITFATLSSNNMLGYSPEEVLGTSGFDLVHPEDTPQSIATVDQAVRSGQPHFTVIERLRHKDGHYIWTEITFTGIYDPDTAVPVELIGVVRDITARKQAEERLREAEELFRILFETLPDAVFVSDTNGKFVNVNSAACRLLSYTREELLQLKAVDFMELSLEEIAQIRQQYLATGFWQNEISLKTREGKLILVDGRSTLVALPGNQGRLTVMIFRDITERKKAEVELQALSRRLQLATAAGNIGTWEWDLTTDKLIWDDQMLGLYGITPDTTGLTTEKEWSDLYLFPEDRELVYSELAATLQSLKPFSAEFRIRQPNGTIKFLKGNALVIKNENGEPQKLIGINWDITLLKQAEENLRGALEKEKELGELKTRFVSMASHEFRTPLASILAITETLALYRSRMDEVQINTRLDKVRKQVNHLTEIIDDVLQQARIQAGRVEFNPLPGDLDACCRDIIEEYENQPGNHGRLNYDCPDHPLTASYDLHLMRQIISNLLSNALKYSPVEKPVHITLSSDETHLELKVQDHGIGIPPEDQAYLFEPFHRASNVGTIRGTGLGLNITRQAVTLHGGTITYHSEADQGTTFTVILPLSPPPPRD